MRNKLKKATDEKKWVEFDWVKIVPQLIHELEAEMGQHLLGFISNTYF